ncbi:MAG: oxalate:formate antiporter [Bacillaceae bacterium]
MSMSDSLQSKIHIYGNRRNQVYTFYGITFSEFTNSLNVGIENLLLLKHNFKDYETNYYTGFDYIEGMQLKRLKNDDVHRSAKFCWIDFQELSSLEELQPREIADLLYFAHKKEPIHRPFFSHLNNNFAYVSENEISKIYFKRMNYLIISLSKMIYNRINDNQRRRFLFFQKGKEVSPIPYELIERLLPLIEDGLIIDIEQRQDNRKELRIPIYVNKLESEYIDNFFEMQDNEKNMVYYADLVFVKKDTQWNIEYK